MLDSTAPTLEVEVPPRPEELHSIDGVCEVRLVATENSRDDSPPAALIELPHGATRARDFERVKRRLASELSDGLREFFFVNTDVGSPECADRVARLLVDRPGSGYDQILILRSLIPRTFIDCNRLLDDSHANEMTAAIPDYVDAPADRGLLRSLYDQYQKVAQAAYREVCGNRGLALQLHTYAPRAIQVERIDGDIATLLREAYLSGNWERWPERPPVDLISAGIDGTALAPKQLVAEIRHRFETAGIETGENETYRLHPATTGYRHAVDWPGQVVCLELRRDLLADPFSPFEEMRIGDRKVERMVRPLADACSAAWPPEQ